MSAIWHSQMGKGKNFVNSSKKLWIHCVISHTLSFIKFHASLFLVILLLSFSHDSLHFK